MCWPIRRSDNFAIANVIAHQNVNVVQSGEPPNGRDPKDIFFPLSNLRSNAHTRLSKLKSIFQILPSLSKLDLTRHGAQLYFEMATTVHRIKLLLAHHHVWH